jgi:hypothetical protein
MADVQIGTVSHYFNVLGVAALNLTGSLAMGDTVKICGKDTCVTRTVASMQINLETVEKAKKGDDVAIKVDSPVKEGWKVYKSN